MKSPALLLAFFLLGVLLPAGCSYVEITPVGSADRVLTGTVTYVPADPVPAGTILAVRIVDASRPTSGPVLLGEQRVEIAGAPPFQFRVEYRAEDALLRRGVNVEAKVLVGGRLRYANLTGYAVTLQRAADEQELTLLPVNP